MIHEIYNHQYYKMFCQSKIFFKSFCHIESLVGRGEQSVINTKTSTSIDQISDISKVKFHTKTLTENIFYEDRICVLCARIGKYQDTDNVAMINISIDYMILPARKNYYVTSLFRSTLLTLGVVYFNQILYPSSTNDSVIILRSDVLIMQSGNQRATNYDDPMKWQNSIIC